MKNILMVVGSLRKQSFNRQLAQKIEAILAGRAKVTYLEYGDLPYMNQDIEFPAPESVSRVRTAVQNADGIWICTPEYNHSIPGGLKNLLDWLSRPLEENNWKLGSAVKGKYVAISGVAGKSAAAHVRKSLKNLLEMMSMNVVAGEGTGISFDANAFHTGVLSIPESAQAALEAQAEQLLSALSDAGS